jgi:GNAT superfamily N-acetyltransferase
VDAPSSPSPDARLLDEIAANAWPALVVQHVDGWRLRVTPSVRARRSSSVLPLELGESLSLDERLALVDAFYTRWGEPVRYQISPAARPSNLDALLEGLGYELEAPVDVQTAVLDVIVARTGRKVPIHVAASPDDRWLDTYATLFRRGDGVVIRQRVLDRIGPPAAYALLELEDEPAAVGMGVLERGWLGIFSMGTRDEFRRRGAATAIIHGLARWALDHGGERAYLQVEATNEAARRLYEGAGFQAAYSYHFRKAPTK